MANNIDEAKAKFDDALAKFAPSKQRGAPTTVAAVFAEIKSDHERLGDNLALLEELLERSDDHLRRSSAEILDAIQVLSTFTRTDKSTKADAERLDGK